MSFLDTMKDTLTVKSQEVAQKVSSVTESAKLNNQIKSNQRMIEKILYHVGEKCFELNGNKSETPYDQMFQEIHRLQKENASFQEQIATLKMENVCPKCGFQNSGKSKFCVNCGALLETDTEVQKGEDEKICASCGTANLTDALFCAECGRKFEENCEEE